MGSLVRFLHLARASLLTARRYSIDWYGSVFAPILTVVPVMLAIWYGERLGFSFANVTGTEDFVRYYIIGIAYWGYVESVWSSIFAMREHMRTGRLEELLLTPMKAWEYILGWSSLALALTTVSSLPLVALAIAAGMLNAGLSGLLLSLPVFLLSMVASFGLAFALFGATLVIREGDELVSLLGNAAPLLGGLYFPVHLLPGPLKAVALAFPFTWGVDLIRGLLVGSKTMLALKTELLLLSALSLLYVLLGVLAYRLLERRMRRRGIQGF